MLVFNLCSVAVGKNTFPPPPSLPWTNFVLVLGTVSRFVKRDLHLNRFRFGCTYLNMKKCVELFTVLFIIAEMIVMCIHCELVKKYVRCYSLCNSLNHLVELVQKPHFIFRLNGRVHLNWQGIQFSRLLAAEVCESGVVMLDTLPSEVMWEYWLPTPFASFHSRVPPHSERSISQYHWHMAVEPLWAICNVM
jgi:hypothetical protein